MSQPERSALEALIQVDLPALRTAGEISEEESALGLAGIALLHGALAPSVPLSPALARAGDQLYAMILGAEGRHPQTATVEEARALVLRFLGAAIGSNPLLQAFRLRLVSAARARGQAAEAYAQELGALLDRGGAKAPLPPAMARLSPTLRGLLLEDDAPLGRQALTAADALQLQKLLHAEGLGRMPRATLRQLWIERGAGEEISLGGPGGEVLGTIARAELLRRLWAR